MNIHTYPLAAILCFVLLSACSNGQTGNASYVGKGGPVTNDGFFTEFRIQVNDSQKIRLSSEFGLKEVIVDLDHSDDSEIVMYLKAPDGSEVQLTYVNGPGGENYRNTCFSNDGDQPIKCAKPPFTGRFRPVDYLGSINNGQTMSGEWKLLVKDWKPSQHSGNLKSWKLVFDKNAPDPVILERSDLPVIVINTNRKLIEDTTRITADMGIMYKKGAINSPQDKPSAYNGKITIETRGSSSQNYSKKSYTFTTIDEKGSKKPNSLLGMPAEKDWILYAPYSDKTLLRNYLAYTLFTKMGHYAPRTEFVELVINGDYRGVYMLTEKIKRNEKRINISKSDSAGKDPVAITGGYILKIDRHDNESQGFYSSVPAAFSGTRKVFYTYSYPDKKELQEEHKQYLKMYFDSFETAITSADYAKTGRYRKYIDQQSFIDFLLLNELSRNVDAYKLSTYLYKDRDNISRQLHIGPVWDFDLAFNNANYGHAGEPSGWQYNTPDTIFPVPQWWEKLMNDPAFTSALKKRWTTLRKTTLSDASINSLINNKAAQLDEAAKRNFLKWPVLGSQVGTNPEPLPKDYKSELDLLKNWISERGKWMDTEIAKLK